MLPGIEYPGVYALAVLDRPPYRSKFSWIPEISYIGMTCALDGLQSRLNQFDDTISGRRTNHGGADRVRYAYRRYKDLVPCLYVAIHAVRCDTSRVSPRLLRALGRVARLEYEYLAQYMALFAVLPEFNDKRRSPKYSKRRRIS